MRREDLTQDYLQSVLHYDAETGHFTWLRRISIRIMPGRRAGFRVTGGYVAIKIGGTSYSAHRLAWLYVNGRWPPHDIDHINGVRDDNRLCNLREATRSQNCHNRQVANNNASGIKGVCWHKHAQKWVARVAVRGRSVYLGLFEDKDSAATAVRAAALREVGAFARFE